EYKKFMIETLDATVYNIKHADLDGENERTAAIDKNDYPSGLVPFSFASNEALRTITIASSSSITKTFRCTRFSPKRT
ncbi:MAG: hypothetical protein AAGL17_22270, partial [Cyanobacteria bacterium J06576_12]